MSAAGGERSPQRSQGQPPQRRGKTERSVPRMSKGAQKRAFVHPTTVLCPGYGLIRGEAIEQAVASGAAQIGLAATAVRAARGMRRVPRFRGIVVAQALAVMMADHRGALPALGPIAAGPILAGREGPAVRLRAGQHVMPIGRIAAAV